MNRNIHYHLMVKQSNTRSVPRQSFPCSFAPVPFVVNADQPQQGGLSSENAVRGWCRAGLVSWLCCLKCGLYPGYVPLGDQNDPIPLLVWQNLTLLLPPLRRKGTRKGKAGSVPSVLHWWLPLSLQSLGCPNLHSEPELPNREEF